MANNEDKEKYNAYHREYYQRNKERLQEYKRNYSKNKMYKQYKKYSAFVDRDLAEKFDKKLEENNDNITDFIQRAVEKYVNEK